MHVALYHPFTHWAQNYSLTHVAQEQLLMLTEHGIDAHLVTSNQFKDPTPKGVKVHAVLPYDDPKQIHKAASPILAEMTTVLTHDVVYLASYKDHETALRKIAKETPIILWLHWIHSAPNVGDKRPPFPNSLYIGMNYTDLPLLAEQFQVPIALCRVVYNAVSPDVFFDWHPLTRAVVAKHGLLDCDVLAVYPLDTGRFTAKGGHKIIKLFEKLRKLGKNAKVVFVNAAANAKKRRDLVEGLASEHVIFTSLWMEAGERPYEVSVPRRVVKELMQIANFFPLLSISEGCSLTLLEAGLSKNLVVLNEDFPPMREFGEIDKTLYMKVSSVRAQTQYHNPVTRTPEEAEDMYFYEWAQIVASQLEGNKALAFNRKVVKQFNRNWIFRNQLEPLLR